MPDILTPRARQFLYRPLFAVLGTKDEENGEVDEFFMWYALIEDANGDRILINTTKERPQYKNIVNHPYVSLCIGEAYQYIAIKGHCTIVDDREIAQSDILRLATRYDGPEVAQWFVTTTCAQQNRASVYVTIEKIRVHWGIGNKYLMDERKLEGNTHGE